MTYTGTRQYPSTKQSLVPLPICDGRHNYSTYFDKSVSLAMLASCAST
jgi:hypothetical protein